MDSELIYSKTASGEEAMLQRTRVMQRNVRMVLILVDGQSTVADLCGKTGNAQLTENALQELEKGGFVEPQTAQDSLWGASRKVAPEASIAAVDPVSQFAPPPSTKPPLELQASAPDSRVFVQSVFPLHPRSDRSLPPFSFTPIQPLQEPPDDLASAYDQGRARPLGKQRPAPGERPQSSLLRGLRKMLPGADRNYGGTSALKPIRRGRWSSMGWLGIAMLSIFGIVAVASLALVFFPYEIYRGDVEAAFAHATGRPVKVATLRVMAYPKPGLFLDDVLIGSGKDEIHIDSIHLQPALDTLTRPKMIFRTAILSGLTLRAEQIPGLTRVFAETARPASGVGVERVSFEKADVAFSGLALSQMEGAAKLSADGLLQSLLLHSSDRSLSLEAKPEGERLDVVLEGFGWRPSALSPFLFDSVNLHGHVENAVFTISSMELRIFDGLIQGSAVLHADTKPRFFGAVSFERINATRLGDAIGLGKQFSGETTGKIRFSTSADSWATVFSAIDADGEFSVRRGSVRGIDLAEAMRRVSRTPVQGGMTLFEKLSGRIRLTPTSYQFAGLALSSGLMQSMGHVEVSKDLQVSGRMELQMHGTVNQRRIPISINGPLKDPSVQAGAG